jgi:hypothetical protein
MNFNKMIWMGQTIGYCHFYQLIYFSLVIPVVIPKYVGLSIIIIIIMCSSKMKTVIFTIYFTAGSPEECGNEDPSSQLFQGYIGQICGSQNI